MNLNHLNIERLSDNQKAVFRLFGNIDPSIIDINTINYKINNDFLILSFVDTTHKRCPFTVCFDLKGGRTNSFFLNDSGAIIEDRLIDKSSVNQTLIWIENLLKSKIREFISYEDQLIVKIRYDYTAMVDGIPQNFSHHTYKRIPRFWKKKKTVVNNYDVWL